MRAIALAPLEPSSLPHPAVRRAMLPRAFARPARTQ